MRAFNATLHSFTSAVMKPVHCFLYSGESKSVLSTGVRPLLKTNQTILNNSQQSLATDAIESRFFNRPILKTQSPLVGNPRRIIHQKYLVFMASTTRTRFICYVYLKCFIQSIDFVTR